jgi:hypothetical protein
VPLTLLFVLQEAQEDFLSLLDFIVTLANLQESQSDNFQASFDSDFRLGPYGFHRIIQFFHCFFILTQAQAHDQTLTLDKATTAIQSLDEYAVPLFSLLLHFRTAVDRARFDPPGFSHLHEILRPAGVHFGVS